MFSETAPAVTFGALKRAVADKGIGADDRVVLLVSGDGLKTPGLVEHLVEPQTIKADSDAFLDTELALGALDRDRCGRGPAGLTAASPCTERRLAKNPRDDCRSVS